MKLKKGDKVYCIKSMPAFFDKGSTYILKYDGNPFDICVSSGIDDFFLESYSFSTDSFKRYFITNKELRKLKLDAIGKW